MVPFSDGIIAAAWKMPPSWHGTGHPEGYWQQAELYALNWCKPNNDDDDHCKVPRESLLVKELLKSIQVTIRTRV